jgi:protein involved in polysaccharide export with SLBB domain
MNSLSSLLFSPRFRGAVLASLAAALLTSCQHFKLRRGVTPTTTLASATAAPVGAATFVPDTVADLPPLDPVLLQRPNFEYHLGPGDLVEVEVVGDIASRSRSVVGPDGKIYFNMLPGIDVWGMTIDQARASLVKEMQRYVREEQPFSVTLISGQSQRVWLLGRLGKPGAYPLSGPTTLLEAISSAGGPASLSAYGMRTLGTVAVPTTNSATDEVADLRRAFVMRDGRALRVDFERLLRQGDLSQNIYLQPDDFVYLPSASQGSVHVLGAVNNPRALEYTPRMTVAQAVAQAGGTLIREAYPSQVAVVRGSLAEPKVALVDLTAVVRGTANDVLLEPQDIVYVPHSPYRVLTRLVDTVLNTFVRVVGVNEGARAVTNRGTPAGVNVPLAPLN